MKTLKKDSYLVWQCFRYNFLFFVSLFWLFKSYTHLKGAYAFSTCPRNLLSIKYWTSVNLTHQWCLNSSKYYAQYYGICAWFTLYLQIPVTVVLAIQSPNLQPVITLPYMGIHPHQPTTMHVLPPAYYWARPNRCPVVRTAVWYPPTTRLTRYRAGSCVASILISFSNILLPFPICLAVGYYFTHAMYIWIIHSFGIDGDGRPGRS